MPNTEEILNWVDKRISSIFATPRMWGGREANELQILQLLEIRKLITDSEALKANPRLIVDAWIKHSRQPVCAFDGPENEFVERLRKMVEAVKNA